MTTANNPRRSGVVPMRLRCAVGWWLATVAMLVSLPVLAGPPYLTDDPEPTDTGHYEIYFFTEGASARDGREGSAGIDFNYGAARNLQLTVTLPINWSAPIGEHHASGLGNIELAAKYEFLHQQDDGVDVAFFPSVILPAGSSAVGERHASLFLPLWLQRTAGDWTIFGGGGCEIHRGGEAKDFCLLGTALAYQVSDRLQIGAEVFHQAADTRNGHAGTDFNIGATYDLNDHWHLLASAGPGLQNRDQVDRTVWYVSVLWTH